MGHLLGYGRVSTLEQSADLQRDALSAAGCYRIFVDTAPGKLDDRPQLTAVLDQLRPCGSATRPCTGDRGPGRTGRQATCVAGVQKAGTGAADARSVPVATENRDDGAEGSKSEEQTLDRILASGLLLVRPDAPATDRHSRP